MWKKSYLTILIIVLLIWWGLIISLFFRSQETLLGSSVLTWIPPKTSTPSFEPSVTTYMWENWCFLCIYYSDDPVHKKACDSAVKKAEDVFKKKVFSLSVEEYEKGVLTGSLQKDLCGCDPIEIILARHGSPWQEEITFKETQGFVSLSPQCPQFNIHDIRCSAFDDVDDALKHAKDLQQRLAKDGYKGTINITGVQTLSMTSITFNEFIPIRSKLGNKVYISKTMWSFSTTKKVWKVIPGRGPSCYSVNTPVGFQVCPSWVTIALHPCKEPGSFSILDRDSWADRTILCSYNNIKANQTCVYRSDQPCERESIEKCPYNQCVWQKPEIVQCTK